MHGSRQDRNARVTRFRSCWVRQEVAHRELSEQKSSGSSEGAPGMTTGTGPAKSRRSDSGEFKLGGATFSR